MDNQISDLKRIINSAINSVKPDQLIKTHISLSGSKLHVKETVIDISQFANIYIVGAGKASAFMAKEIEILLDSRITDGFVSVKYGHSTECKTVNVLEAGHPVIDENSLLAAENILKITEKANNNDLVICLLSGGGSSLLEKLVPGVSLEDLQNLNNLLFECGADINEINTIRKHLSLIKGGELAKSIYPAALLTFIVSDVIGDPLEVIASGPTSPDSSTFESALNVIGKYKIEKETPVSILSYLQRGNNGEVNETIKPGNHIFDNVHNIIIGNILVALTTAEIKSISLGYDVEVISSEVKGESKEAAKSFTSVIKEKMKNNHEKKKPLCMLMGGETTVTIHGSGKGGRNQEFVLVALLEMEEVSEPFIIASIGTDGTDGPTDAAGGFITNESWKTIKEKKWNPESICKTITLTTY